MPDEQKRCTKLVGVNDRGHVVGESHHRAVLTDHEVDLIFELHEDGWGYGRIAQVMEVHKATVQMILSGKRRAQTVMAFKRIHTKRKQG